MSVVISSAINPNSYDPISDLKKQEVRKIPVIVNINNACLVQGGVDTVMKSDRGRAANMESVIENSIEELSISDTGHASQPSPSRSGIGSESPFGFLNDDVVAPVQEVIPRHPCDQSRENLQDLEQS